jgi:branched-chain amino acid transport system substrate-binding protein
MGHLNSGVSIPSSKVYADKKIVQISPASTNPDLTLAGLANVFRVCTTDAVQGPAGANMAATQLGFKSAFVVDDSTPYGTGLADEFAKEFEAKGGKILGREKTSDKDQDFSGLVTKMKDLNPDLIYYGGIYNAGALLAKQAKEGGMTAPLMGGDGLYDPEFVNIAGKEAAEGDLCTSIGYPVADLPAGQEFVSAYEAAYPGENIAAYDAYSYDAANIIINAVYTAAEKVGADKVTAPEGRDAIIAAVAANDSTGVTGKISFDDNGDTTNKVVTLYKVVNGEWASQASVAQ